MFGAMPRLRCGILPHGDSLTGRLGYDNERPVVAASCLCPQSTLTCLCAVHESAIHSRSTRGDRQLNHLVRAEERGYGRAESSALPVLRLVTNLTLADHSKVRPKPLAPVGTLSEQVG